MRLLWRSAEIDVDGRRVDGAQYGAQEAVDGRRVDDAQYGAQEAVDGRREPQLDPYGAGAQYGDRAQDGAGAQDGAMDGVQEGPPDPYGGRGRGGMLRDIIEEVTQRWVLIFHLFYKVLNVH